MKIEKYKYLFSFALPLSVFISLRAEAYMSWFGVLFLFGFIPLVELFLKGSDRNLEAQTEKELQAKPYYDGVLYLMFVVHLSLVAYFLWSLWKFGSELPLFFLIGKIASMVLVNAALGSNLAHELGHRRGAHNKFMSLTLLSTTLYMHFLIEHNKNHHKNVATPLDHASAEKGISLYKFLSRSFYRSFKTAFKVEPAKTLQYLAIELFIVALIAFFLGSLPAIAFVGAAIGGGLLIEGVNYIEHYGLRRKLKPNGRYEKVGPEHSWNSNHPLSRMLLFELSRHSDHHANADRPYQVLRHFDNSPQFPTGYPGMLLLATIPKLWFMVMNPMLPEE